MDTNQYLVENHEQDHPQLEQYLTTAITRYGIQQLNCEEPKKLYSCLKNKENSIVAGIMGYASLNMFFITHLFVDPSIRNQGFGQHLLMEIEHSATNLGCDLLRLNTLNANRYSLYPGRL